MNYFGMLQRGASRVAGTVIRRVHHQLLDRGFDRRLGAQTEGVLQPGDLTIGSSNGRFASEYTPTATRVFKRAISALDIAYEKFALIDFGSGKGRILLLAADLPFLAIEGVEFASELHQTAVRNIARLAALGRRTDHIRPRHLDATEYVIPQEPCVFYMYNPFGAPVLSRVLENIEVSYLRNPRPMYCLYVNPKFPHLFAERPFFRPVQRPLSARLVDRLTMPEPLLLYATASHFPSEYDRRR